MKHHVSEGLDKTVPTTPYCGTNATLFLRKSVKGMCNLTPPHHTKPCFAVQGVREPNVTGRWEHSKPFCRHFVMVVSSVLFGGIIGTLLTTPVRFPPFLASTPKDGRPTLTLTLTIRKVPLYGEMDSSVGVQWAGSTRSLLAVKPNGGRRILIFRCL